MKLEIVCRPSFYKAQLLTFIALLLHRSIKERLDTGDIVIVPVAGAVDEWKCIVTRKDKLNETLGCTGRLLKVGNPDLWPCLRCY